MCLEQKLTSWFWVRSESERVFVQSLMVWPVSEAKQKQWGN